MSESRDIKDVLNGSLTGFASTGPNKYAVLGSANVEREDVIAVFFKPLEISTNFTAYHTYILYSSHKEKRQFIFRGGPGNDVEPIHSLVYFFTGAVPDPKVVKESFGYLMAEVGDNSPLRIQDDIIYGSPDFNAQNRNFGVIIKKGDDLTSYFSKLKDHISIINGLKIRYNPSYPNSNTYVYAALSYAKLPGYTEAIDSYPESAENKSIFDRLFVPGYAPLDITSTAVVYDHGRARSLEDTFTDFTEIGGKHNANDDIQTILDQDNEKWKSFNQNQTFYDFYEKTNIDELDYLIQQTSKGRVKREDISITKK